MITRILTALLLALAIGSATMFLTEFWFAVTIVLVTGVAFFELCGLVGISQKLARIFCVSCYLLGCLSYFMSGLAREPLIYFSFLVWIWAILSVVFYPRGSWIFGKRYTSSILGALLLSGAAFSVLAIRESTDGYFWFFWLLVLTTSVDAGGYFVGRKYGKTPLAPKVSPGKTIEGLAGGVFACLVICGTLNFVFVSDNHLGYLIIIPLAFFAVLGDLVESVLKRVHGKKDSGSILPGHGGVLDRIDSIIPVMTAGAVFLAIGS